MKKIKIFPLILSVFLFYNLKTVTAADQLLSVEFPNGTVNISDEVIDVLTGYKLTYYNMKHLQDVDNKTYYQFNSQIGSYVKIESPEGEYFQAGDEIKIDTYVNRNSNDQRDISIYNKVDYNNGVLLGKVSAAGSVNSVYTITLDENLPKNTNLLYMPATSSINAYINIRGVEVFGKRGNKANLSSLMVGETAITSGYKIKHSVEALSEESSVLLSYVKEEGKNVSLSISEVLKSAVSTPNAIETWNPMSNSLLVPEEIGGINYYYIRSSLPEYETVYYEIIINRRNTEDVIYNYDLTVNPIVSSEDPAFNNIIENSGNYHSQHGWRYNYTASPDKTLKLKVENDAIIKIKGSVYNSKNVKITATVDNDNVGKIVPASSVTAVNGGEYNNFYYSGGENIITLTYSGEDGGFITYITIINEGTAEKDFRAIFIGDKELSLENDFIEREYSLLNVGYIANPSDDNAFPKAAIAMKKGLEAPEINETLDVDNNVYTYTFTYNNEIFKVYIPFESNIGFIENADDQRYEISSSFGLKTVIDMLNKGTATYSTVYLPDGNYDLGDFDGSYLHGISLTASNVVLLGESHNARITGTYYGVTSSVVEIKGSNNIIRNLTIENLLGDNGVGPALNTGGTNLLFDNVKIIGWQDTYVGGGGPNLFYNCIVAGSVDFICNGGENTLDYFFKSELQFQYRKNGGYIAAPQGKVFFIDCLVTDVPTNTNSVNGNFSLARPWRETGKAFFINTKFDIIPNYGFVTMSSNVFPKGSCGSIGNLKMSDNTVLIFPNNEGTPYYEMTENDIATYGSVYNMCGKTLSDLIFESITIGGNDYKTLYFPDALVVPEGVTAFIINEAHKNYVELSDQFKKGDIIPALTPVLLKSNVDEEQEFRFKYANNNDATTDVNILKGNLTHRFFNDNSFYTLIDNKFYKQNNAFQKANDAYLILEENIYDDILYLNKDEALSIKEILNLQNKEDKTIYDLSGRIISNPVKGNIYIINGKKILFY